MKLPDLQPGLWRERYESLRRHFLENRPLFQTDPWDLILFLRRGVAGWMRGWATMPAPSPAPASPAQSFPQPSVITAEWQHQLTVVLAQMTARHLPATPGL